VRSLRASKIAALLLAALPVTFAGEVSAHRRDEYLQAARIGIEADRIHLELALTPGIAVAGTVIRDIDHDRDGTLSQTERQAYARRVLGFVRIHVDGSEPLHLAVASSRFPDLEAMRGGDGTIAIQSDVLIPPLTAGTHRLLFRNRNAASNLVFLANALAPATDRIAITGQRRDRDQRELTIEFVVR